MTKRPEDCGSRSRRGNLCALPKGHKDKHSRPYPAFVQWETETSPLEVYIVQPDDE